MADLRKELERALRRRLPEVNPGRAAGRATKRIADDIAETVAGMLRPQPDKPSGTKIDPPPQFDPDYEAGPTTGNVTIPKPQRGETAEQYYQRVRALRINDAIVEDRKSMDMASRYNPNATVRAPSRPGNMLTQVEKSRPVRGRFESPHGEFGDVPGFGPDLIYGNLEGTAQRESRGGENIIGMTSSARGVYQFMKPTWEQMRGLLRMKRVDVPSWEQWAEMGYPRGVEELMMRTLTDVNRETLRQMAVPDTPLNLDLAHNFGPSAAKKMLDASADTPIENVLPRHWLEPNRLTGLTVGEVLARQARKIGQPARSVQNQGTKPRG